MVQMTTEQQQIVDVLRSNLLSNVDANSLNDLLQSGQLPKGFNKNILQQAIEGLDRVGREVRRTVPKTDQPFLHKVPKAAKLTDIAGVIELLHRIGTEESTHVYDEFLGLLLDSIWSIFYAQEHRKNIHFPKYKALFKLFADEMRADVNRTPSQVLFTTKQELFLRTMPAIQNQEVK